MKLKSLPLLLVICLTLTSSKMFAQTQSNPTDSLTAQGPDPFALIIPPPVLRPPPKLTSEVQTVVVGGVLYVYIITYKINPITGALTIGYTSSYGWYIWVPSINGLGQWVYMGSTQPN